MAINPNIILSGNQMAAPQLPDVNAMMQTRTAGMENIYAIEQQRAAQAQAAQKEQEAALVDALAPAYATAFKGGGTKESITAAYNLLPPEIQPGVKGQIDKLMVMPSDDLRLSALEASLAGSDAGRTLLDRIPTEIQRINAEIQRGQLEVSRANAAREAAGVGVPKPMSAYEAAQTGLREREVAIKEEEAAAREETGGIDPKVKLKLDQAYPQATRALQSSVTSLDQDIQDVEKLLTDDVGLKAITGYLGAYTPNVFKDATRAQALLDKIMSGAGFSALQAMRDASPTGGALGNVSNQEGAKLEKSVAAFSQAQDYDDFREALRQYLIDLKTAQGNVQSAFDETYSYRGDAPSAGIVEQTKARRRRIEEETATGGRSSLPPGVTVKRN
jgi:hypothetical protein